MRRTAICLLISILMCALASREVRAHKFYASFVTMNYNPREQSVEITMRIFPDDLEAALRKQHNKVVHLDKSKAVAGMIMAYLRKTFELKKGGRVMPLRWVGIDLGVDSAFIYVEVKMAGGLSGAQLRDHFLFEMFDEQTNVVSIKYNGKQIDQVFRRNEGEAYKLIP